MRCTKCGSYVEAGQVSCPVCGTAVDVSENVEKIQAEIGSKIDRILNDKVENLRDLNDGVEISDGHMDVSKTQDITLTRNLAEEDTVFKTPRQAPQQAPRSIERDPDEEFDEGFEAGYIAAHREEYERSEYEKEQSRRTRAMEREAYQKSRSRSVSSIKTKSSSKSKAGLIIGIIAAVVIIGVVAVLLVTGLYKEVEPEVEPTTAETTTAAETDEITCSVDDGGEYTAPVEITLESARNNRIYYTLDGKAPSNSSNKYVSPIKLDETKITGDSTNFTLRVVSYNASGLKTGEEKYTFTLKAGELDEPVFSLGSGNYSEIMKISISAEDGAEIYYTYDGSTPTTSSEHYGTSITMKRGNNVLSAIAVKGTKVSDVASAVYNLTVKPVFSSEQVQGFLKNYLAGKDIKVLDAAEQPKEGEGYARLTGSGTSVIGDNQYFIFICEIYDKKGKLSETRYYGLNDQTGDTSTLEKDGSSYTILY